ncbi:MAG: hypothetical protein RBU30_16340 [Polyangia bacterium]|jgi:hypothetical protein|nr:hypothetical protein [Polyangia bacterium]
MLAKNIEGFQCCQLRVNPVAVGLLCLAGLASVATSAKRPPPTHRPVYMGWKEFRASAEVQAPREIQKRGKIYTFGTALFLSEPGEGIHVIDNSSPEAPRQVAFLRIPGNFDLAIRGRYLYADSFVDLVIFEVSPAPIGVRYARRVKNVFPYDMTGTMPRNQRFWPTGVDRGQGVVLRWEALEKKEGRP